uniref:Crossover junction endonuclease MUS81 n=1 Tax=Strigamia maritima TaxID=126957 RepID=T1J8L5_STRMM
MITLSPNDLTIRDVFVKQLLQLNGVSIDKALAIIEKYSTPSSLIEAYKQCDSEKEKENLISNLKFGLNKRNVGPAIISNSQSLDFSSSNQFCLRPEQYEIVLCVDNCETASGEPNSRKLMLQNELRKNGVTFDIRKLHVGDYAWVAREKVSLIPGQLRLPKGRELVLDHIVERKRMDDLSSSIKDGRFHEQKFRMKECGLRHPIYLVEEIGTSTSLPESTLIQAISNTQSTSHQGNA